VGPEVAAAFRDAGHSAASLDRWFAPGAGDRAYLDLPLANRDQLEAAGIPAAQIHVAGLCTKSFADVFHSYRAAKDRAGRMVGIIRARRIVD
jgi:polyphenol oxidase